MATSHDASFHTTGAAYDDFMGRYSLSLSAAFVDAAGVASGWSVLDVGCGPGALTGELVERLGTDHVVACDPSAPFVDECARRHPGVDVVEARAESLPFDEGRFDAVLSQLVMHFVEDPSTAASEFVRVTRPGGTLAACVWDFDEQMQLLRHFWDAALAVDPDAPAEHRTLRFGRAGELAALLHETGCSDVTESTLEVASTYADVDELWNGFLLGIGPAGSYCVGLSPEQRSAVRTELVGRLGSPTGAFSLTAMARCVTGRTPD